MTNYETIDVHVEEAKTIVLVNRGDIPMGQNGKSLPENLREEMESAFGHDFSDVRVHTDASSGQLNRTVGARAHTAGSDIFFSPGQYQPETQEGRRLLSHELTHVVQQASGRVRPTKQVRAEQALSSHLVVGGQKAAVK